MYTAILFDTSTTIMIINTTTNEYELTVFDDLAMKYNPSNVWTLVRLSERHIMLVENIPNGHKVHVIFELGEDHTYYRYKWGMWYNGGALYTLFNREVRTLRMYRQGFDDEAAEDFHIAGDLALEHYYKVEDGVAVTLEEVEVFHPDVSDLHLALVQIRGKTSLHFTTPYNRWKRIPVNRSIHELFDTVLPLPFDLTSIVSTYMVKCVTYASEAQERKEWIKSEHVDEEDWNQWARDMWQHD